MKLKIHHPKLLILVLIVVGVLATGGILIADLDGGEPVQTQAFSLPVPPTIAPPNDEEVKDAMSIARESGWVSDIAGKQEWELLGPEWGRKPKWISIPGAKELGIMFNAVWEEPVESDGPWYIMECQRTRLIKGYTTFSNIHTVLVVVDMDQRQPLALSVSSPFYGSEKDDWTPVPGDIPPGKKTDTITDMATGEILYEGYYKNTPAYLKNCPPGKEDYLD